MSDNKLDNSENIIPAAEELRTALEFSSQHRNVIASTLHRLMPKYWPEPKPDEVMFYTNLERSIQTHELKKELTEALHELQKKKPKWKDILNLNIRVLSQGWKQLQKTVPDDATSLFDKEMDDTQEGAKRFENAFLAKLEELDYKAYRKVHLWLNYSSSDKSSHQKIGKFAITQLTDEATWDNTIQDIIVALDDGLRFDTKIIELLDNKLNKLKTLTEAQTKKDEQMIEVYRLFNSQLSRLIDVLGSKDASLSKTVERAKAFSKNHPHALLDWTEGSSQQKLESSIEKMNDAITQLATLKSSIAKAQEDEDFENLSTLSQKAKQEVENQAEAIADAKECLGILVDAETQTKSDLELTNNPDNHSDKSLHVLEPKKSIKETKSDVVAEEIHIVQKRAGEAPGEIYQFKSEGKPNTLENQHQEPFAEPISLSETSNIEAILATGSNKPETDGVMDKPIKQSSQTEPNEPEVLEATTVIEPEATPDLATTTTSQQVISHAYLTDNESSPNRHPIHQSNLLWSMIDRGYTLIAYWFLKSLEEAGAIDPNLPSANLFKAAAIAPYITDNYGAAATLHTDTIIEIDTDHHHRVLDHSITCAVHYLSVAATLQSCIFTQSPITSQILRTSAGRFDGDFSDILIEIAEMSEQGHNFTMDDFGDSQIAQDNDKAITEIKEKMEQIKERAIHKKQGYYWVNVALKDVVLETEFAPVLTIIKKDRLNPENIQQVQAIVSKNSTHDALLKLLEERSRSLQSHSKRSEKIVGDARNYFVSHCSKIIETASEWLELQKQINRKQNNYSADKAIRVIERLKTVLPKNMESLEKQQAQCRTLEEHAGLTVLLQSLASIKHLIESDALSYAKSMELSSWIELPRIMMGAPIVNEERPQLADELVRFARSDYDYLEWARKAVDEGNLKLADQVCSEIKRLKEVEPEVIAVLRQQICKANKGNRAELDAQCVSLERRVNEAANAGLLPQKVSTDYRIDIDLIQQDLKSKEGEFPNYQEHRGTLNTIQQTIREATNEHLAILEKEWINFRESAKNKKQLDEIPEGWENGLKEAIEQGDVTVAEEYIQQFRDFTQYNAELFDYRNKGLTALSLFLQLETPTYEHIHTHGLKTTARTASEGGTVGTIDFSTIKENPKQVLFAIDKLRTQSLKKLADGDLQKLGEVMRYVGFQWPRSDQLKGLYSKSGNKMLMVELPLQPGKNSSPVPSFGSQHDEYYPVVLVWKYRTFEEIGQFLQQHQCTTGSIMLFMEPISPQERIQFATFCHNEKYTVMMLDPVILLFLSYYRSTDRRETSLRSAFKVCLPFTYDNPYVAALYPPPPEMVFGRRHEIDRVVRQNGVAILYGGRQLGKSTILKEVESRLHRPDGSSYAFYISSDTDIGKDLTYESMKVKLWNRIKSKLQTAGLVVHNQFKDTDNAPDKLIDEIMSGNPHLRITILLDEADYLLNSDSLHDFSLFRTFRNLFYGTNNRFRVVIAGLQNVQRFSNMPNNPLNQLGESQPVKILPSSDAIRLIREPLSALGYTFEKMTTVNRILAYTNNHAGLIQLFCHYLIEHLNSQVRSRKISMPGYEITEHDIEHTYQTDKIRDSIVDRFNLTLRLDPRYRILANGLILENIKLNYFNVKQAKDIGDTYWPKEFRNMTVTKLGAILKEMVGLGVLIHDTGENNEDLYRFRNTNVFQLLGSEEVQRETIKEITENLDKYAKDPTQRHRRIEIAGRTNKLVRLYSPLTLGDELELTGKLQPTKSQDEEKTVTTSMTKTFDVTIASIYGSYASGLKQIKETLPWLSTLDDPDTSIEYRLISIDKPRASTLSRLQNSLKKVFEFTEKRETLVTINMPEFTNDIALYAEYLDYLYSLRRKKCKHQLWIILLFDPATTWLWLSNIDAKEIESEGIHIPLQCWEEPSLERILNDLNMLDGPKQICYLKEKTGGWYEYVKLFSDEAAKAKTDDPELVKRFNEIIAKHKTTKKKIQSVLSDLGINAVPHIKVLLTAIIQEEYADEISQETIELFSDEHPDWNFVGKEKLILDWLVRMGIVQAVNMADGSQFDATNTRYALEPITRQFIEAATREG